MKLKQTSRIHFELIGHDIDLNTGKINTFSSWEDESKFSWDDELEMAIKCTNGDW